MAKIDKDLRGYLKRTQAGGALLTVEKEVDPYTEAPSQLRGAVKRGKALMFRNVAGSAIPAVGNSLALRPWIETALECGDAGIVHWIGQRSAQDFSPVISPAGPLKEVIENEVVLEQFPILTFHEEDGGPYITGGIGISKDRRRGVRMRASIACD